MFGFVAHIVADLARGGLAVIRQDQHFSPKTSPTSCFFAPSAIDWIDTEAPDDHPEELRSL